MGRTEKREAHLICGRELLFKSNLTLSFLAWYEENIKVSTSKEICTKLFESLDVKQGDENVDCLYDDEKIEILNIIAESNGFSIKLINSCDDFVTGLKEYYCSCRKELNKSVQPFLLRIQEGYSNLARAFKEATKDINISIQMELLSGLKKAMEALPVNVKKMQDKLMLQGWYIPLSILLNLKPSYANRIINSDITDVNDEMLSFAQEIEDNLLMEVELNFNNRYEFISESLRCHKEGNYRVSIPIMLIQADGITLDIIEKHLFTKQDKRKKIIEEIYKNEYLTDALCLYPLLSDSAITANIYNRKVRDYYKFNRHEILHGEDLEYGTRENSYRCIMLLKYLIDVNNYIKEYK